jgi:hypothetical protein
VSEEPVPSVDDFDDDIPFEKLPRYIQRRKREEVVHKAEVTLVEYDEMARVNALETLDAKRMMRDQVMKSLRALELLTGKAIDWIAKEHDDELQTREWREGSTKDKTEDGTMRVKAITLDRIVKTQQRLADTLHSLGEANRPVMGGPAIQKNTQNNYFADTEKVDPAKDLENFKRQKG